MGQHRPSSQFRLTSMKVINSMESKPQNLSASSDFEHGTSHVPAILRMQRLQRNHLLVSMRTRTEILKLCIVHFMTARQPTDWWNLGDCHQPNDSKTNKNKPQQLHAWLTDGVIAVDCDCFMANLPDLRVAAELISAANDNSESPSLVAALSRFSTSSTVVREILFGW